MSKPVITVSKDASIFEAVKLMDNHNIGDVPIVEDDKPVGIITERDILRKVVRKEIDIHNTKVTKIMTKNPVTVSHKASLLEVTRIMSKNNFRRLLVVKKKKLIGIVTAKDIITMMSA
ncbi:CBS domain-containing protein [Candidatus Woesearchaeota archaeon]|nr:CBS domain-containing protein [Candidatus Woesearchaeota archaeon]